MKIKNKYSVKMLTTYIFTIILRDNLRVSNDYLTELKNNFQKRPEKYKEIFRKPTEIYYNFKNGLGGDCDDYTTLISYIAYKLKIPFRLVFLIKNDSVFHIYPELYKAKKWQNWDRWNPKLIDKDIKKLIIEPCYYAKIGNNNVKFCL